jgi:hypothetical protein
MILLVCGGCDYFDRAKAFMALDRAHAVKPITMVIQGGAHGADALAKEWAQTRGVPQIEFAANWKKLGRRAGPMRNKAMLEEGMPQGVLALPGGTGTADMIAQAKAAGVKVWRPYG